MNEGQDQRLVGLLKRARREQDRAALDEFLRLVSPPLERALRARMAGRPEFQQACEDILQETLSLAMTRLETCRAEHDAQVMAWLLAILRNTATSWVRSNLPRILATCSLTPGRVVMTEDDEAPRDPVWEAVLGIVRRAFGSLPPETQAVVSAHLLEDTTWAELGERFETTPSGVRRRYQRARDRMRREFWRELGTLTQDMQSAIKARLRLTPKQI